MSKSFDVKALESERFKAVSFSLDARQPEEYRSTLENRLGKLGIQGEVLFDLLACNGSTSRRFVAMSFDGAHLNFDTMRIEPKEKIGASLFQYCRGYYSKNRDKLGSSVLSAAAKRMLDTSFSA